MLARLTPAGDRPEDLSALGRIHISLATIGVGVFALASALSAIYLVEDRALKRKKFDTLAFKDGGAPLESLDRLSHRLIWVGFPIFTVALVLGAMWTARLGEILGRHRVRARRGDLDRVRDAARRAPDLRLARPARREADARGLRAPRSRCS